MTRRICCLFLVVALLMGTASGEKWGEGSRESGLASDWESVLENIPEDSPTVDPGSGGEGSQTGNPADNWEGSQTGDAESNRKGSSTGDAEITPESAPASDREIRWNEGLTQLQSKYSALGLSVAVFQNGEIIYTFCGGQTRLVGGEAITPDTLFQTGSISKMVANIALVKLLWERGISLDAEIGDVLGYEVRNPAYPDSPVTLRQLMTHTASLRDDGVYQGAVNGNARPLREMLTQLAHGAFTAEYAPGEQAAYSNFGGGIIGSLIEALSGENADSYIRRAVFAPLGITGGYQAGLLDEDLQIAWIFHMPSHRLGLKPREGSSRRVTCDPDSAYLMTAGKLVISSVDLAKIGMLLCDGGIYQNQRILPEDAVGEMLTLQNDRGSVHCQSDSGLFVLPTTEESLSGAWMGHDGMAYGMLCGAFFEPDSRAGMVLLTNGCEQKVHGSKITREALKLIFSDFPLTEGRVDAFEVE